MTEDEKSGRKRRRGGRRKATKREDPNAHLGENGPYPDVTDAEMYKFYYYLRDVAMPRAFARIARRLGSHKASADDFRCHCPPSFVDGLPICQRRRENCRFEGRTRGDELAENDAYERWMALRDKEIKRPDMAPPWLRARKRAMKASNGNRA